MTKQTSKARKITPGTRQRTTASGGNRKAIRDAEQPMRSSRGRMQVEVLPRRGLV